MHHLSARPVFAAVLFLALFDVAVAVAQPRDVPPLSALTERISMALGGADGGRKVLEAAEEYEFVYRRTLREVLSDDEITADHRYVSEASGARARLDIRILRGDGVDSSTLLDGAKAHLIVEDKAHVVKVESVRNRLREFGPDRLFSVPLALAADGRRILGETDLSVQQKLVDKGAPRLVLVAIDEQGVETARLEVDARNYRPISVSFRSPAGLIAYRYGDYREVAPGLIVPFEREFSRNGRTVSVTQVIRFRLKVPQDAARYDPSVTSLAPIPKVPPPPKP
jgi:hypothetical protein